VKRSVVKRKRHLKKELRGPKGNVARQKERENFYPLAPEKGGREGRSPEEGRKNLGAKIKSERYSSKVANGDKSN